MNKKAKSMLAVVAVPVVLFIIFSLFIENYNLATLRIIFTQAVIPTIIGFAICYVNAAGMFDLSCGAAVIISAMIGGTLSNQFGLPGLIVGCLCISLLFGAVNGLVYRLLRIPCLIVSLGLLLIYEILAQKIGLGVSVKIASDVAVIGKFPNNLIVLAITAVIFYLLYNRSRISCHIRALGSEELLAGALGVNVAFTKSMTFVLAGAFLGIASILQISYANSITAVSSLSSISMVFQPLMGVLIAVAIKAWCEITIGVFISQLTITMVFNALIACGLPSTMQDVVLGAMLIAVMGVALNNERIKKFFNKHNKRKALNSLQP